MNSLIIIDPGHGGSNTGASGNGIREKDINLVLANRLYSRLEYYNTHKIMTRYDDSTVSLSDRVSMANSERSKLGLGFDRCVFLSMHSNGFNDSSARGYEDFTHTNASNASRQLQNIMNNNLGKIWVEARSRNRGKKTANFYVLRNTNMVAILIENGFITNPDDAGLLKREGFQAKIISGTLDTLEEFLGIKETAPPAEEEVFYRVVTGSFKVRENAERRKEQLKKAGFESFIDIYKS